MTKLSAWFGLGALLLFAASTAGCAAQHAKPKLVVPRRCITKIALTERTRCVEHNGVLNCEGLALTYACTEVERGTTTKR